jgi:hypothetical protein
MSAARHVLDQLNIRPPRLHIYASQSQTSGSFVMSEATTCGNAIEPFAEAY